MVPRFPSLYAALVVGMLAGCSSLPVGSILPLSRIDIESTALPELRVAVRLPTGLRPQRDGVTLDAVLRIDGQPERRTSFLLVETHGAGDTAGLAREQRPGFTIFAYKLSAEDTGRFDALRQEPAKARGAGRTGSLGFGVATRQFCLVDQPLAGPLLTSTYIWTSETGRYVVASDGLDLRNQPDIASDLGTLTRCAN